MSQHHIEVLTPTMGPVLVTVGIDPRLDEAFMTYMNGDDIHLSPSGMTLEHLQPHALEQLGVRLPQQLLKALEAELSEWRRGATDIGRRIRRYDRDGTLVESVTF